MNVYLVQTKVFYTINGIEYQAADALQNITCVSSYKKALDAMNNYEKNFEKIGYKRTEKYNNQFPHEHFTMKDNTGKRVVIYILKEEVE